MNENSRSITVVSIAGASDAGTWVVDYLPDARVTALALDDHRVEEQIASAFGNDPHARAWVAIDQRLMGFLYLRVIDALVLNGARIVRLVHPAASVSPLAVLGDGCLVGAGAVLSAGARVGDHSRVWERAVIARGARVGSCCTIEQGCVVGENVSVGDHCWLRKGVCLDTGASAGNFSEFHIAGTFEGDFAEGTLFLPGLDGPARIHRFG